MRTLTDTLPDLIWLKDTSGVYPFCTRRFEGLAQCVGESFQEYLALVDAPKRRSKRLETIMASHAG